MIRTPVRRLLALIPLFLLLLPFLSAPRPVAQAGSPAVISPLEAPRAPSAGLCAPLPPLAAPDSTSVWFPFVARAYDSRTELVARRIPAGTGGSLTLGTATLTIPPARSTRTPG